MWARRGGGKNVSLLPFSTISIGYIFFEIWILWSAFLFYENNSSKQLLTIYTTLWAAISRGLVVVN
jgi:hypothetical protein